MRELSLFSGAGGGLLATKWLLGWRTLGYVEIDDYCQKIIAARIRDDLLDDAPIFGDIRTFIREGFASGYRGMVDIVSAGFPCQPFSIAGQRKGAIDDRNMWPETVQCIRIVRPRYVLLENVPALLADKYIGRIFGDLAESGYDARWDCIPASAVGANHQRDRLWIVGKRAVSDSEPRSGRTGHELAGRQTRSDIDRGGEKPDMADAAEPDDGKSAPKQIVG